MIIIYYFTIIYMTFSIHITILATISISHLVLCTIVGCIQLIPVSSPSNCMKLCEVWEVYEVIWIMKLYEVMWICEVMWSLCTRYIMVSGVLFFNWFNCFSNNSYLQHRIYANCFGQLCIYTYTNKNLSL